MANLTITNYDPQSWLRRNDLSDQYLFTGDGADSFTAGTILGRITSSGKYYVYNVGDSPAGTVTPCAILMHDLTTTAAVDYPVHVLLAGEVDSALITIDGSAAGAGITEAIKDSLRTFGIHVVDKTELNDLDTQD